MIGAVASRQCEGTRLWWCIDRNRSRPQRSLSLEMVPAVVSGCREEER